MATKIKYFGKAHEHLRLIDLVVGEYEVRYKGMFSIDYLKELINCLLLDGVKLCIEDIQRETGDLGSLKKKEVVGIAEKELASLRVSIDYEMGMEVGLTVTQVQVQVKDTVGKINDHLYFRSMQIIQKLQATDARSRAKPLPIKAISTSDVKLGKLYNHLCSKGFTGGADDFIDFIRGKRPHSSINFKDARQIAAVLLAVYDKEARPIPWSQYCSLENVTIGKSKRSPKPKVLQNAKPTLLKGSVTDELFQLKGAAKEYRELLN